LRRRYGFRVAAAFDPFVVVDASLDVHHQPHQRGRLVDRLAQPRHLIRLGQE
jgi:hypothetical protein